MKNPIIEKAIERFDELCIEVFLVAQKNKIDGKKWNSDFAPIMREIRNLLSEPFK